MYQPPHFREEDLARKQDFVRAHPFGLLVTAGAGGLHGQRRCPGCSRPAPVAGDAARPRRARQRPWRECVGGTDALVVFQGPDHYITPSWYATKQETHKVVPTWNYAMVQARGMARAVEDPAWLHAQIRGADRHDGGPPAAALGRRRRARALRRGAGARHRRHRDRDRCARRQVEGEPEPPRGRSRRRRRGARRRSARTMPRRWPPWCKSADAPA